VFSEYDIFLYSSLLLQSSDETVLLKPSLLSVADHSGIMYYDLDVTHCLSIHPSSVFAVTLTPLIALSLVILSSHSLSLIK
jgi:hypothetical protein